MFKDLFTPPQPLRGKILETIRRLKVQNIKLEQVTVRLRQRDRILFESCAAAIRRKSKERAMICANELAEVRKLLNIVVHSQLAIERIVLRLETLKELSDVIIDLKPALRILQKTTRGLVRVMPEIGSELEKVNDSITETLAVTRVDSPQPITPFEEKTPAGEEILEEVSTLLEERLKEELPKPPASIIITEKVKSTENVRQMIALTAGCSEVEVCEREEPQTGLSYKDVKLKDFSFTIQKSSSLEETLLEYVKRCKGEIDVSQCSMELNVPSEEVMKALQTLGAQGRIRIQ